jgi:hypothetical protein
MLGREESARPRSIWLVETDYTSDYRIFAVQSCGCRYVMVSLRPVLSCADPNQGTDDVVFSPKNAEEEIKLFINAAEARLVKFPGGVHFLSWTHEEEVAKELLGFIGKWGRVLKASL